MACCVPVGLIGRSKIVVGDRDQVGFRVASIRRSAPLHLRAEDRATSGATGRGFGAPEGCSSVRSVSDDTTDLTASSTNTTRRLTWPDEVFGKHKVAGLLVVESPFGCAVTPRMWTRRVEDMHDEQHVGPLQGHSVDVEEVWGEQPACLSPKERSPVRLRGPA